MPKLIKQIAYVGRIIIGMTIGERLRERRQQIGLSLGQVGEYEGLTPQYLSDLERGRNQPNVWSLLTKLAKRYRTTTDYLLGLTDDPDPVRAENRAQEAALLAQLPGHERAIVRAPRLMDWWDKKPASVDPLVWAAHLRDNIDKRGLKEPPALVTTTAGVAA